MKKFLLVAICAMLFMGSTTTTNAQNLKQSGGEKNLQVLFAPLGGTPISIGGIAYRKFNAAGNRAWRVNLFIGLNNKTEITTQADTSNHINPGDGGSPEADKKTSGMTISIRPGYEWHCAGTERLSPYCGIEALFSMTTAKVEQDSIGVANYVNTPSSFQVYTLTQKGKGASTTFGINLLAGVDYYIAKNLSLGAEIGFGFSTTSMPNITNETIKETVTTSGTDTSHSFAVTATPDQKQGSSMQVGPNAVGQLKLGWLF